MEEKKNKVAKTEIVKTGDKAPEVINAPAAVIEYAIKSNAPIDQLEKLLLLQERHDANQARKGFHVAMAAFKENPPEIEKDRTVKYKEVKYNHASLGNVTKKIGKALAEHGLSASWITKQNGMILVTCKITHSKGHSEETTLSAAADTSGSKNAIQAIGSTVTYLQRYTLLALTGLATYDDDDGKAAGKVEECITDDQHHQLADLIASKEVNIERFCKAFGIDDLPKMPKKRFKEAELRLNAKAVGKLKR